LLDKGSGMRFALLALIVSACGTDGRGAVSFPPPDAFGCITGMFQIVAPVEGQHYDPALAVLIDFAELDPDFGDVSLTMVDDTGTSYAQVSDTEEGPSPGAGSSPYYRWRFDYTLAPAHRYELTVTPDAPLCDPPSTPSVTFFTSSP